ncbi:MAG: hypothetical protein EBQ85_02250 [Proteobacteria bacterium]|nr:hypothetical protein [Pseudomonadota bacterium]
MSDQKETHEENAEEVSGEKPWWSEVIKDVTATGLATLFMTEEGVRSYLREKKLPKELTQLLLDSFHRRKDGFYEMLTREFGKVLAKVDLTKEMQKFLENHEIDVHAKVSFKKREAKHEKSD